MEAGESVLQALERELEEELGIVIGSCEALLEIAHDYVDKSVLLDVWLVQAFEGQPRGREGQALAWCLPSGAVTFLAPNAGLWSR